MKLAVRSTKANQNDRITYMEDGGLISPSNSSISPSENSFSPLVPLTLAEKDNWGWHLPLILLHWPSTSSNSKPGESVLDPYLVSEFKSGFRKVSGEVERLALVIELVELDELELLVDLNNWLRKGKLVAVLLEEQDELDLSNSGLEIEFVEEEFVECIEVEAVELDDELDDSVSCSIAGLNGKGALKGAGEISIL